MGKFIKIDNNKIKEALKNTRRQYFVGNLSKPQEVPFVKTESLEMGITSYDGFASEPTHRHATASEYQYMISGRTQYMDTETHEVYEFIGGDFYMIESGTSYAQRAKPGTKIIFVKVPSINDKELVDTDKNVEKWLAEKLKTVRTDYYYNENAPQPNSIRPAAAVAIIENGNILMLRRSDNNKWTMPGGTLEFGESLTDCAVREVKEESGLDVQITDVIGTYTDPNIRVAYSDGEVRQEFTIVYSGQFVSGTVALDDESTGYHWVPLASVDSLELADSQRRRLKDVVRYYKEGQKSLK